MRRCVAFNVKHKVFAREAGGGYHSRLLRDYGCPISAFGIGDRCFHYLFARSICGGEHIEVVANDIDYTDFIVLRRFYHYPVGCGIGEVFHHQAIAEALT